MLCDPAGLQREKRDCADGGWQEGQQFDPQLLRAVQDVEAGLIPNDLLLMKNGRDKADASFLTKIAVELPLRLRKTRIKVENLT